MSNTAAKNKTQATDASVQAYLAQIEDPQRRADCEQLVKLMSKATKQPAYMWGSSIVGFGSLHYRYESGREGDMCVLGFSSRKGDISIYGTASAPEREALLEGLGKHKLGKGCLYVRRLEEVDVKVLAQLFAAAVAAKA